jgi:Rrf2 family transcriptional regulator, cysteine metabolism repressor
MKLPAKIEYGCKAVMELALRYNSHVPVRVSIISQLQNIPRRFLAQILIRLKNARIVGSARGISGGYFLAKPPSQISLADVFMAMDDNIIGGVTHQKGRSGKDADSLVVRLWQEISDDVVARLQHTTYDDLVSKFKNGQVTYYI